MTCQSFRSLPSKNRILAASSESSICSTVCHNSDQSRYIVRGTGSSLKLSLLCLGRSGLSSIKSAISILSCVKFYGAPIVSLFYMLNICSIYVEYSFYISNICSVFQMFVPYFKYLFYIPNIYSQFEIFVLYPKKLCYTSNICSV